MDFAHKVLQSNSKSGPTFIIYPLYYCEKLLFAHFLHILFQQTLLYRCSPILLHCTQNKQ